MSDRPKRKATSTTRHGNGAGWGGAAKGSGSGSAKVDFDASTNDQGHSAATPIAHGNKRAARLEKWDEQAAELMGVLYVIATDEGRGPTQERAIVSFQNRVWGAPTQRQEVKLDVDLDKMTDEQLASIAAGAPIGD